MNINVEIPDCVLDSLDKHFNDRGLMIQDYQHLLCFLLKDLISDTSLLVGSYHKSTDVDVLSWTSKDALLKHGCKTL